MIALAQNMDREAARRAMEARRQDPQPWEEIVASNGYRIPKSTGANTAPFEVNGRRLGFVITEPNGLRVLHTETVAFFDVDVTPDTARCKVLQHLYRFVGENPEYGFRVYRTAAGLRYLCTSGLFDPTGDEAQSIMRRLCVDSKYATMCLVSRHFAARLSPKPKRCKSGGSYAASAYQFSVGNPVVQPDCLHVLKRHDQETGAFSELPLA